MCAARVNNFSSNLVERVDFSDARVWRYCGLVYKFFKINNIELKRVSMGWWPLRLSAKILALLRLSINFFQLRLTKKLKINFFCFKKLNIN